MRPGSANVGTNLLTPGVAGFLAGWAASEFPVADIEENH